MQLQHKAPSLVPKAAGIVIGQVHTHMHKHTPMCGKSLIVQDEGKWGGAAENSTLPVSKMFLKAVKFLVQPRQAQLHTVLFFTLRACMFVLLLNEGWRWSDGKPASVNEECFCQRANQTLVLYLKNAVSLGPDGRRSTNRENAL